MWLFDGFGTAHPDPFLALEGDKGCQLPWKKSVGLELSVCAQASTLNREHFACFQKRLFFSSHKLRQPLAC
jgi:hypothetical protein